MKKNLFFKTANFEGKWERELSDKKVKDVNVVKLITIMYKKLIIKMYNFLHFYN